MTTPSKETVDAVIIGTGQAGQPLARARGRAGRRTAIVERDHVGGICINHGCTPTKTMVASGRVAWLAGRAAECGVRVGGPVRVAMDEVIARKRRVVESFTRGAGRGSSAPPACR
jgi:pyruvate/2-oxoglutarate dehydrogenase complex dihydrolipoamide dehydrogenase (E3) component